MLEILRLIDIGWTVDPLGMVCDRLAHPENDWNLLWWTRR